MWLENMNKNELTGVILIDLRKAFDLVNHGILLNKLKIYQCDQNAVNWFESYLSDRKQKVVFEGYESDTKIVKSGVPQGSVLGPLFFLIFMNDLHLGLQHGISLDMYADDSTICASGRNITSVEQKLNQCTPEIVNWCKHNKMVINTEKTKSMLITTYQKRATLKDQALRVCIDDTTIEHSTSEKLLGLIVDQNLTWNSHVKRVHLQTSRNIALLRRIKNFLPLESRILFYNSFIQPYLDYCSAVWDTCPNSTSLHKLQKRAARIILDKHYLEHSTPLFKKLNWIPLPLRFKYRTATLMFRDYTF